MTTIEIFNLIASIFSIVTGAVALALSVVFYLNAKKAERNADGSMNEIKSATTILSKLSMKLLDRLTSALIAPRATEEKLMDVLKSLAGISPRENGSTTTSKTTVADLVSEEKTKSNVTKADLEQFRIDNLITALYYAGNTNLSTQAVLLRIEDGENTQVYTEALDRSYDDFSVLKKWLVNSDNSENKIKKSPMNDYYTKIMGVEDVVKNAEMFKTQS